MEINQERLGIPPQEYKAVARLQSNEFQRISRDLNIIGDTVQVTVVKGEIKFSVNGDMGDGNVILREDASADAAETVVLEVTEPVSLSFALKYFISFTKATALSQYVQLQISPELPLSVQYKMEEGNDDLGFIRYYLAPKMDDDADDTASADM